VNFLLTALSIIRTKSTKALNKKKHYNWLQSGCVFVRCHVTVATWESIVENDRKTFVVFPKQQLCSWPLRLLSPSLMRSTTVTLLDQIKAVVENCSFGVRRWTTNLESVVYGHDVRNRSNQQLL
jgi:hypothetical protein